MRLRWFFIHPSQVLTGLRPFYHIVAYTPVPAVLRGERPREPLDAVSLGFSDTLWELVQLCWSEYSSTRPNAQRLLDHFSSASPTWAPPLVYPAIVATTPGIADADVYSYSGTPPATSQGIGTFISIGSLLAFISVLLLFSSI